MKLLITHEIHARRVGDGYYNKAIGVIEYNALCNYRYRINDIVVVLRCQEADEVEEGWLRVDGDGVSVAPIPEPTSFYKLLLLIPRMIKHIVCAVRKCDRYMVRLPGPTGTIVVLVLFLMGKKYGVEMVGHASESFLHTRGRALSKRIVGSFFDFATEFFVWRAHCVAYRSVYLQRLYPNKHPDHEWVFSGAQLDEAVITRPRDASFFNSVPFNIIFVGRLWAEKGLGNLLTAFDIVCNRTHKQVMLHFVGDGAEYERLQKEANRLGRSGCVKMHGRIPRGPELFSLFDQAHLFVLPSLTEGMPRALIEAMARGLPAIGSAVGGIPELLDEQYLFPPNNPEQIAEKILLLIDNPQELARMSIRNFEASKAHWKDALKKAKDAFWSEVVEQCK